MGCLWIWVVINSHYLNDNKIISSNPYDSISSWIGLNNEWINNKI